MDKPKFKVGDVIETPNHSRLLICDTRDGIVFCVKVTDGEFLDTWHCLPQQIECCEYVGTIDLSLLGINSESKFAVGDVIIGPGGKKKLIVDIIYYSDINDNSVFYYRYLSKEKGVPCCLMNSGKVIDHNHDLLEHNETMAKILSAL